jgi:hypothetical protein
MGFIWPPLGLQRNGQLISAVIPLAAGEFAHEIHRHIEIAVLITHAIFREDRGPPIHSKREGSIRHDLPSRIEASVRASHDHQLLFAISLKHQGGWRLKKLN